MDEYGRLRKLKWWNLDMNLCNCLILICSIQQRYPSSHQEAQSVPDRRLSAKSHLSGAQGGFKKMEYADPELAAGDEPFYYRVR